MKMPDPDAAVIARRLTIADDLRTLVPGRGILKRTSRLLAGPIDRLSPRTDRHADESDCDDSFRKR